MKGCPSNSKSLAAIAECAFEAFITNDKRMEAEGQLYRRLFAILILSATNWPVIEPHVGNIAAALETAEPGKDAHIQRNGLVVVRIVVGRRSQRQRQRQNPQQRKDGAHIPYIGSHSRFRDTLRRFQ